MDLATVRRARAEREERQKEPRVSPRPEAAQELEASYKKILETLSLMGYPTLTDDNFTDTAGRAARAMLEMILPMAEIQNEIDEMLARTFPARYDEMVISKHNVCFGMCPHHLLPVIYRISVAYLRSEEH